MQRIRSFVSIRSVAFAGLAVLLLVGATLPLVNGEGDKVNRSHAIAWDAVLQEAGGLEGLTPIATIRPAASVWGEGYHFYFTHPRNKKFLGSVIVVTDPNGDFSVKYAIIPSR